MTEQQIIEGMIGAYQDRNIDELSRIAQLEAAIKKDSQLLTKVLFENAELITEVATLKELFGKWLPIESAPDGGKKVWTFGPYHDEPDLREPDGSFWRFEAKRHDCIISVWMPQISPPAPKEE